VDEDVERRPLGADARERRVDLGVDADIHRQHELRAEFARELGHALLDALVLVAERELGPLAGHGLRDAVRDGTIGREPHDQGLLACQEPPAFPPAEASVSSAPS
jgi:hypothetical protein